jgi:hypothetical protein
MRRLGSAVLGVVAVAMLAAGAGMVGEPLPTGGPMHFDFNLPFGVVCLAGGVILLDIVSPPGWVFVLSAVAVLVSAGRNFYEYPPIGDGAYFLLRYGREALDDWAPAQPFAPMLAFDVVGWAVARAFGAMGKRLVELGLFVLGAAASCTVYEMFMRGLIGSASSRHLALTLAGLGLFAAGCGGWASRSGVARLGLGLAAATLLVSLASWGLYELTLVKTSL